MHLTRDLQMMLKKALQILLIALPVTFAELWLLDFGVRLPTVEVVAQTIDERKLEADRLSEEGKKQFSNSQFEEALQLWQQALVIYREIGYRQGEANSLFNLGIAYRSLAEHEQAIDFFEQSLAISREIGDHRWEALYLYNLGIVYSSVAEYERAIDFFKPSLEYEGAIGSFKLSEIVTAYDSVVEYEGDIDFYEQSLAIARKIGDRQREACFLTNLGVAYRDLAEYEQAIDFNRQSLAISREIGYRQGEAGSLNGLGDVYRRLAEYEQAIDFYEQSLALAREIGDRRGEAMSLGSLGDAYSNLAEYEQAIDFYEQSLAIFREINNRQGETVSLNNIGSTYNSLAEYELAIDFNKQSLTLARQIGDLRGEAFSLFSLGNAYSNLAEYELAIDLIQQSLAIFREIGDRRAETCSLCDLGTVYSSLVEYEGAIDLYKQSLALAREIGDPDLEALSLANLGAALANSGNFTEAEPYLYDSIKIYETIRAKISLHNDDWRVSIFEKQTNPYIALQQVLIARNKPQQSLLISERGRAQALVNLLLSKQSLIPKHPNLQEIKKIAQEQNATLVEYSVIPNGELYIWIIPPDGEIQFRTVNLPQDISLQQLVKVSREQIGIRGRGNNNATPQTHDATNHLQQLHQLLIAPIAELLPENEEERIIFIPHRELFLVPFAALQDQNTYLIEKHTILTAPSIQSLSLTRKHRQRVKNLPGEALVVGNPTMPKFKNLSPLPGAETEAKKIAEMLNTEPLLGAQATEKTIVEKLPKAKIIHLATHGLLDDISGVGSPGAIALAPSGKDDGFLNSREIMEKFGLTNTTPLQAELVVLSACDTGRGDIKGEGVVGLSRSLIAAGVPSLVVSLWKVPDHATQELMVEFYTNLYKRKLDKAQALRQAMLTMLEGGENPDPLDWAAFTVIGEAE